MSSDRDKTSDPDLITNIKSGDDYGKDPTSISNKPAIEDHGLEKNYISVRFVTQLLGVRLVCCVTKNLYIKVQNISVLSANIRQQEMTNSNFTINLNMKV